MKQNEIDKTLRDFEPKVIELLTFLQGGISNQYDKVLEESKRWLKDQLTQALKAQCQEIGEKVEGMRTEVKPGLDANTHLRRTWINNTLDQILSLPELKDNSINTKEEK